MIRAHLQRFGLMEMNMTYSFVLLAATCTIADANDAMLRPVAVAVQPAQSVSAGCGCNCTQSFGLLDRLKQRFAGHGNDCACTATSTCQAPCRTTCNTCKPCNPCNPCDQGCVSSSASVPGAKGDIRPEYTQRVAIADDTSWIVGQLFYLHVDGGTWVVRYAPLGKEDKFGGEVVLAHGVDMKALREGDLAFVRGEIIKEARASKYVGGPLYRAVSVELNDRVE
jgi:hypothetical protein